MRADWRGFQHAPGMNRAVYAVLSAILAVAGASAAAAVADDRPNIVFVMADDLGLGDVGQHVRRCLKRKPIVPTPRIDELAEQGMWFSDGPSSTALCSPTR